jgi:hypothetical protein
MEFFEGAAEMQLARANGVREQLDCEGPLNA